MIRCTNADPTTADAFTSQRSSAIFPCLFGVGEVPRRKRLVYDH